MATTIKINGVDRTVDVDGDTPLLWVLRNVLGMTGTKLRAISDLGKSRRFARTSWWWTQSRGTGLHPHS